MGEIRDKNFDCERALFRAHGDSIANCGFSGGESPLKHGEDFSAEKCRFLWRYPLWYCRNISISDCFLSVDARAPMWYTENFSVCNIKSEAPKGIRRCRHGEISNSLFAYGNETLWECDDICIENTQVEGDYFALNSRNLKIDGLKLNGKYSFDGCRNVVIKNSVLLTKDAFWNSENITVYDSFISAEYLGWNSKNLTLINCTVKSLQGMCFCENLVMRNCRTEDTTLAFEHSSVDAEIVGGIDSIFNPESGIIKADSISELIIEDGEINPDATQIICENIKSRGCRPVWSAEG